MCPRMLLDPIRGTARAFGTREQGDGRKWVLSRLLKAYEESATITPVVGPDRSGLRLYSCSLVLCEGGEWGRGCESTVGASGSGRMPTERKKQDHARGAGAEYSSSSFAQSVWTLWFTNKHSPPTF